MRWILIAVLLGSINSWAKTFKNSYISFEMPANWSCTQDGAAWTCNPANAIEEREAIIVLTAKIAGPGETMASFKDYLSKRKSVLTKSGNAILSTVLKTQNTRIDGQNWVESVHLNSEVPGFQTTYLATVKNKLAILVSLSAEKSKTQKYNPIFQSALRSLKIIASHQILAPDLKAKAAGVDHGPIGLAVQHPTAAHENNSAPGKKAFPWPLALIVGVGVILIAGLYFVLTK